MNTYILRSPKKHYHLISKKATLLRPLHYDSKKSSLGESAVNSTILDITPLATYLLSFMTTTGMEVSNSTIPSSLQ